MKRYLVSDSIILLAAICLLCGYSYARAPQTQEDISAIEQQIKTLSVNKCIASQKSNAGIYKTDYRNLLFCKKPLILPSDVIPSLPVMGDLFKYSVAESYKKIKDTGANRSLADVRKSVNDAFLNLVGDRNTYTLFSSSMYLSQDMAQYKLFISEIKSRQMDYAEYNKFKNDSFMAANEDFDKDLLAYNPKVFEEEVNKISEFARAYNKKSTDFITQVLIPLTASEDVITGEVSSYLNRYNYGDLSRFGIKRDDLIALLLKDIPTREEAERTAKRLNRSASDILADMAAPNHTILYFISLTYLQKNEALEETFAPLSLFEVFSFSYYEKRIKNGRWITNEDFVEKDTNAILATALNSNIYRIADRLMEFEKPFYYGMFGKVNGLTDNVLKIALSDTDRAGLISAKASFNLYNCGSYKLQNKIYANNRQKEVLENAALLSQITYTVLDLSVDIPLLKLFASSAKAGKSFKGTKSLKKALISSVNDINKTPSAEAFAKAAHVAQTPLKTADKIFDGISAADVSAIEKYFGLNDVKTAQRVLFSTPQMQAVLDVAAKDLTQKKILVNRIKELGQKYSGFSSVRWGGSGGFLKLEYIGHKLPSGKINPKDIVAVVEVGNDHKDYAAVTAKLNSFAGKNAADFVMVKGSKVSLKPSSDADMAKLYDYLLACAKPEGGKCRFIKTGEGGILSNADKSVFIRLSSHEMKNPHFHIYNKLDNDLYVNYSVNINLPGFALNKGKEFMLTKPLRVMQYNHLVF